jgi:hypothetical protein
MKAAKRWTVLQAPDGTDPGVGAKEKVVDQLMHFFKIDDDEGLVLEKLRAPADSLYC